MSTSQTEKADGTPTDPELLINELTESMRQTAQDVLPWFLEQMPYVYFLDTDRDTQLRHLRTILALRASGRPLELTMRSEDGSQWTSIRPLDYPGVLAELASELPDDQPLLAAKIHTANDGELVIDTFIFGDAPGFDPEAPDQAEKLQETLQYAAENLPQWTPDQITDYFQRCRAQYVLSVTPLRMARHWDLFHRISGTDGTTVSIEPEDDPSSCRIVVAVGNATRRRMLERIALRLSRSEINIHHAYLDTISDGQNGSISLLGFVVSKPGGGPLEVDSELWRQVRRDILHLKWLDWGVLKLTSRQRNLSLVHAEIILALANLVQQRLVHRNRYAFTQDLITKHAEDDLELSTEIACLLMDRFNPDDPLSDELFETRAAAIDLRIDTEVDAEEAMIVLHAMVDAVRATYRTNLFLEDRYGLALRIDPSVLSCEQRQGDPYGVFYVYGRGFSGFHVRFRDIARGGVRAVHPGSREQFAHESERLYDEVYDLAFAQQLKNKDIPEGGSKAALLVHPLGKAERSVKAFVDCILDLITPDPETRSRIVDHFGHEELLYLGPDENITPRMINWIVDRAARRGYPMPTALMSSKPGAGINHKEYGVTSEGVAVFLEAALAARGIDPRSEPFTIKMTGGPDGDVGGNLIRILVRDFGDNARFIGIADGSGSAEDPDGLNAAELTRLFEDELPIAMFDPSLLGSQGRVVAVTDPDGVQIRNTMHNRLIADAFVPCGGRPNTIHSSNWRGFLDSEGVPSSPIIIEGANLFLTPHARDALSEAGVMIFKDSSANKCGVICSSFEIVASMLLTEETFLTIKPVFVEQVLLRLRELAGAEAELLVRLHAQRPDTPLPKMSIQLSRVMMRVGDAIEAALETMDPGVSEALRQLVIDHLPPVLTETVGETLWEKTPAPYLKWIMAKSLAARMVYREGLESIEAMSESAIAETALRFLAAEQDRRSLAQEVMDSTMADRERIARILAQSSILNSLEASSGDETP